MRLEYIEDLWRLAAFIAGVKGQIDYGFLRIAQIDCVILCQGLGICIAHRRLALLLEAQTPGAGWYGHSGKEQRKTEYEQNNHRPADFETDISFPKGHKAPPPTPFYGTNRAISMVWDKKIWYHKKEYF